MNNSYTSQWLCIPFLRNDVSKKRYCRSWDGGSKAKGLVTKAVSVRSRVGIAELMKYQVYAVAHLKFQI